jgi:hypothetical protein
MNKEAEIGKPLRNCDVGTAEEQYDRHDRYCGMNHKCFKCVDVDNALMGCMTCFAMWLHMPYKEEEMENEREVK